MKKNLLFLSAFLLMLGMAFTACNNTDDPDDPNKPTVGNAEKLPFSESFATGIGKFTEQSVKGEQKWTFDSRGSYMKMTGHVSKTEKHENEDWLISPKIDLIGVTAVKMTFDYNCSYFRDLTQETTIWVSENYTDGLPSTATWQPLAVNLKSFKNWDIISSDEISLTAYAGKVITIAFKYTSTDTDAGTWEIKNFNVQEGEATAGNTGEEPGEIVDPVGDGTEESPYNIAAARANQGALSWVEGYIVGNIDGEGKNIKSESKFEGPFTIATNLLIADTSDETDYTKCVPVQLPFGAVREGLNLVDNAANDGKKVKLYGSLEKYYGVAGLKSVTYYELEGGKTGGTKPIDVTEAILNETLMTQESFDKFTAVSVKGDFTWRFDAAKPHYGAQMSGYDSEAKKSVANEDWLISPAIDLTGKTNVTLTFDHARGPKGSMNIALTNFTVWVSNDYNSGAPNTATWTELTGVNHGTTAWGFVSSGELKIPTANLKSNLRFAFKYLCTDAESATWEIKNVVVK
ncbi:MAG: hypothetical protein GX361_06825 [Bacteroidales bacterium]|nr:hypothetical protein [Bacteroidales bacterium]